MKVRSKIAKTCLLGALLSTTAMLPTGALGQSCCQAGGSATGANAWSDGSPTSAQWPPDAAAILGMTTGIAPPPSNGSDWWFHGTVEVGGRDFVNNPQTEGIVHNGQKSLAGYYEYSDVKPGAFGNFDMSAGTKDGRYQIDIGGSNVGYEDQHYYFNWSEAGVQYLNFTWDQSPHVYSMGALTPFVINGNVVTLNPNIPKTVATEAGVAAFAAPVEIGMHRDTAEASYRWTPDGGWDFNLEYSHLQRTGTQPSEAGEGNVGMGSPEQYLKPVKDTTQNYGANGEYVGTSPWGQRYVFSLGYDGSQYRDSFNQVLVQGNFPNAATKYAYESTWPSNQANGVSSNLSADLPWNSRYVGTLSFTSMMQNASFPLDGAANPYTGPTTSLDGNITTLLTNNTLTTKLSDTVTAKTTYRYYDYHNNTAQVPESQNAMIGFACTAAEGVDCMSQTGAYNAYTLSMGYIKTNVGETLNWRPNKYWNLGVAYGFERYDWTRADVDVTNDNSAKVFADYKPFEWLTSRASAELSSRRYENYNYCALVGSVQWDSATCTNSANYSVTEQQFMFDDRQLWKANYLLDVVVARGVTVTPWMKYQEASYSVDPNFQQGLSHSRSWDFGIDGGWVIDQDLMFMAGYSRMYGAQNMYGNNTNGYEGAAACVVGAAASANNGQYVPACQSITNETDVVNSFVAAVKYIAIPDRLDTELRYTASHGVDDMQLDLPGGVFANNTGPYPENKVWYQRLEATAVYKLDRQEVAAMGWRGDVKLKLKYAWERNSETNWANDPLSPTTTVTNLTSLLWLGWYNPNYNAQILSASLVASW